jgi:3-hydroxyisobutyrate dehydrogenase
MTDEVGFIGLGRMGGPMARNVAAAGFSLVLRDESAAAEQRLAAETGGRIARSPADMAGCGVVVTMLPTSAIVADALLKWEGGVPQHLPAGAVVVDMSSSVPRDTVTLGARLAEHGVALVDAPVSGGVPGAVAGTLSIMMGADDPAAAERAQEVVDAMSARIYRTGGLGTGHAVKALNNFVAASTFVACGEALIAAERFGLDPATLVDVLNTSTGRSFVSSEVLGEHVVGGRYASGFSLPLMTKDVGIALNLLQEMSTVAGAGERVYGALHDALEELGDVDHTRAVQYWSSLGREKGRRRR